MLLPCCLCAAFLAIPVYLQSTISQTAFLALNKKFMNQYNQRKNQQIMANLTTTNMTVDIQTDKQSKATFLPENSYLGYRQLNQVYQNLTKALACYGCGDTCPSPAACIGTFSTGDKLLIILETIQTKSELRYQKMTVRQIARFTGHIKTLTGTTIQIENLSPFDTTSSLKVYIQIKWGIPTSEQVLIYGGTILLDSWTLAERYIDGAATITLVVRK